MPEKEQKLSQRLMSLWLKREPFGIGTLAMLATALAEENGSRTPPRRPAVFLTRASPLRAMLPIPSPSTRHLSGRVEIVGCARGEGFNRRVPISVVGFNASDITPLGAPKLLVCAVGIESVRYDFERFLLSQRSTTRLVELISL